MNEFEPFILYFVLNVWWNYHWCTDFAYIFG